MPTPASKPTTYTLLISCSSFSIASDSSTLTLLQQNNVRKQPGMYLKIPNTKIENSSNFLYPIPMTDQHEPQQPKNPEPNIEKLSPEEWEKIVKEKLQPLLPILKILNDNKIKWAFTGSFTAIIEGLNMPAPDVDIVVPKDSIDQINQLLGKYLKAKPNNQRKFSPDLTETVKDREFLSAAWGTLIDPDNQQEIGDIVADYSIRVPTGENVLVAGISANGFALSTGYTKILGQGMRVQQKVLPVTLPGENKPLNASYFPFEDHLLKYLLGNKEGYFWKAGQIIRRNED